MVDIKPTLRPRGVNSNSRPPPKATPRKSKVRPKSRNDSSDLKSQPSTSAKSTTPASTLAPALSPQHADDQSLSNQRTELDTILMVDLFPNSFYIIGWICASHRRYYVSTDT